MEKWPICRICLVKDVRMYAVVNKNLHQLYEKLTDVPFVTEDSRPMLACFFCCAKLKQFWRFQRKCLEAEELFTQMMNEDYVQFPFINTRSMDNFSNSQIEVFSIVDSGQTESDAIKEELPDVGGRFRHAVYLMEEHQTKRQELENVPHESDFKYEVPLMEIKTEVVDVEESIAAPLAMEPRLDTQKPTQEETTTVEQKNRENSQKSSRVSKIRKTQNRAPKRTKLKKAVPKTQNELSDSINSTVVGTSCDKNDTECEISNNDDRIKNQKAPVTYTCDICQHSFIKNSDFIRHIRVHTGEKPYKCDICERSFKLKYHLKVHNRIHTGEKPYECEICHCYFRHKSYLTSHKRIHTGEKPYKCNFCESSFHQKIHLTTHIRTHTGEKPYNCEICQRNFAKKGDLVNHIRTHTGEKPYNCELCLRGFTKKIHFVSHCRTHADDIDPQMSFPYSSDTFQM